VECQLSILTNARDNGKEIEIDQLKFDCFLKGVKTYLLWGDRLLGGLVELLNGLLVVTEILLTSNKDDWKTLAEVKDFRDPLRILIC
jgi:hypothetical protein